MAARTARSRPRGRFPWAKLSDRDLLEWPIKELGLTLEGTWLEPRIESVSAELAERGLRLKPHFWLSDEWFCPAGVSGVAIPFYLAHPRLMRLERSMMLEVEGGNKRWCDRLLRHELGHAVQHA
ncbi:MAG: hypothetical protein P1V51_24055 [Deltaproteobacteria bacterium]|nr:hypothetical protein [Deltaproteobacteria bacterium]